MYFVCLVYSLFVICTGQAVNEDQKIALEQLSDDDPWYRHVMVKHRRLVGLALPALFYHFIWWSIAIKHDLWHLFPEKYFMSVTMIFGSMVAGME